MIKHIFHHFHTLYLKPILSIFILSTLFFTSCYYESKIHAKDYSFEKYYRKPKTGKLVSKLLYRGHIYFSIYEDSIKNKRLNPVYRENYGNNKYKIEILYLYNKMVKQDGIMSENELLPIVINSRNGRIIGSGLEYTDSIRKKNYLERN